MRVTVIMFSDIVESVIEEYELVLDMACSLCFLLLCGLFLPATCNLLTLEHSERAVCLPVVSDWKLVVSKSELTIDAVSYSLGRCPFILD